MADQQDELLTFSDFFERWVGSKSTLRRRLEDGTIPKHQPGGPGTKIGIPRSALSIRSKPNSLISKEENSKTTNSESNENIPGPIPKWRK